MLLTGLQSTETKLQVGMLASGHWLKKEWNNGTTWQTLPAVSRLLCGSITLLVSLLFKPVTTGQHPHMQLVSVLCKPVSSIPTSLSFSQSFYPCFSPFFNRITAIIRSRWSIHGRNTCLNLRENGRHLMTLTPGRTDRQFTFYCLISSYHVRNNLVI